jgi:hypothetical protein
MRIKIHLLLAIGFFCVPLHVWAQTGVLSGAITSEYGSPITHAEITVDGNDQVLPVSDSGTYQVNIPNNKKVNVRITALGYEIESFSVKMEGAARLTRNVVMTSIMEVIEGTVITDQRHRGEAGMVQINTKNLDLNPTPVGGVEGLLKVLVGSRNELSSQYTVRGGNFDENLVYVNDFEIYRPFLVRSGQQEGLSFVNSDLVRGVNFSTGGFQSKFGDKMSSVLDVTYKKPKHFGGSVMLSLLGAQAHLEGSTRNNKFTYLVGLRQKSNQYLLQSQPTKGQYNPSFTDVQVLLHYKLSQRWETEVIANYARNRFGFEPQRSEEAFGYVNEAYRLTTAFNGSETDQFDSRFAGWSLTFLPNDQLKLKLLVSGFQTNEHETYDIKGEYFLDAVETDLGKKVGEVLYSLGTGTIHDYARNYLTANVGNIAFRGSYNAGRHFVQWGADAQLVDVKDKLLEWQRRDSAGYSQPYDDQVLHMNKSYRADNTLGYTRLMGYLQNNILLSEALKMTLNLGVRVSHSFLNGETVISPRVQYSFVPQWKRDVVFRLATGIYAQPPFYREMRAFDGALNTSLKAQKSYHAAAGLDYNFKMWGNRPFKLTAEVYYKQLWDLVPYEYDNVRIRYFANNNGRGYAYGGELRLFGDLVRDAESWVSVGYLQTANQIKDEQTGLYGNYIPRPTDQRFTFGMYFSDYLPRNKNFKMFLNLMYATGLPFSPPGKALQEGSSLRIPDYKRVDIGFAALLLDGNKKERPAYSLFRNIESVWLSAEVFNLLGIQNTLSYQWIQDYTSNNIFAVPNRLTARLINVKLAVKF